MVVLVVAGILGGGRSNGIMVFLSKAAASHTVLRFDVFVIPTTEK